MTDTLKPPDELAARVFDLADTLNRHKWLSGAIYLAGQLELALLARRLNKLEDHKASFHDWDQRRLEELERIVHLHLHPEEYTHR